MEDIRYRQGMSAEPDDARLFSAALSELGYPGAAVDGFMRYRDILLEWNTRMNLTAITEPREVLLKHFADSATVAEYAHGDVIDIGTGAGFPGVPVKLLRPDIRLTLLDSLNKRIEFLRELISQLGIDAECVHARAEELSRTDLRESYDLVVSRAVAPLSALAEYCLPYAKIGGKFISMKGPDAEGEILQGKKAITVLGGEIAEVKHVKIPFTDIVHSLIIIGKVRQTPAKYPRKAVRISKNPIS